MSVVSASDYSADVGWVEVCVGAAASGGVVADVDAGAGDSEADWSASAASGCGEADVG